MMARVAKIDNAWKKRFERKKKKRLVNVREKLVYFLIVCEGEKTEPNYFKALERELPLGTVEIKIDGVGLNTLGLIDYAIKVKSLANRRFDRVWVVFDKDDFPESNFNGAIAKAIANNIYCAWTNQAFELWFLLHFQFVNSALNRWDYKSFLEREIQRQIGNPHYSYEKNDPNTYTILKKLGNQTQAIEWAIKLKNTYTDDKFASHNPCTRVHELISELLHPQKILQNLKKNPSKIK